MILGIAYWIISTYYMPFIVVPLFVAPILVNQGPAPETNHATD